MKEVYVDHSATTKLDKKVLEAMLPYLEEDYGNPSSLYRLGRKAKETVENSRQNIASIIGAKPEEIYFTSGGTEANNTLIKGIARTYKKKGNHIITSKIEHPSVLDSCKALEKEGFEVSYVNVLENGQLDIEDLNNKIKESTILISVMYANNEIGTIQPIEEISKIAKEKGIYFHTDAVQAIGSMDIDVEKLGVDALTLSAHKFYGPKGIGAFYIKKGVRFEKYISGGHQEKNKRAGTENVAGIIGMAKALELSREDLEENNERIKSLRDYYLDEVKKRIPHIKINGYLINRLPGNANISYEFIEGESLLLYLDLKGIYASTGSACSSDSLEPSHVLLAIGVPHEIAHGSLRVSIGKNNTKEEIDYLVDNLVEIVGKLRELSPLYEKVNKGDQINV